MGTVPESDMSLYTVKGFTNKIKQGETVKIQVEKVQTTEPTDPNEGEDDKTNTDSNTDSNTDQNANNGEATNTNINVETGNDTPEN